MQKLTWNKNQRSFRMDFDVPSPSLDPGDCLQRAILDRMLSARLESSSYMFVLMHP